MTSWTSSPPVGPGLLQAARLAEVDLHHIHARQEEHVCAFSRTPCQHGGSERGARRTSERARPTAGTVGIAEPHRRRRGHASCEEERPADAACEARASAYLVAMLLTRARPRAAASRLALVGLVEPRPPRARARPGAVASSIVASQHADLALGDNDDLARILCWASPSATPATTQPCRAR